MTDLLGPGTNTANSVTTRPADTRTFGSIDTWAQDQSAPDVNDGTAWVAAMYNSLLAQIRNLIRGANVAVNNTNDNMLLQAVATMAPPYAVDSSSTPGELVINVNQPGFALEIPQAALATADMIRNQTGPGLLASLRAFFLPPTIKRN